MSLATVIIPTYNRGDLLDQTLHSLTKQSYTDFNVIVVDHGSTDKTGEVSQNYLNLLHLAYHKIGREDYYAPGVPRNFGVQQAETSLIIFLDTGAITPPWYIQSHLDFHQQHPDAVGIGLQHGYQSLDAQSGYQKATVVEDFEQAYEALKEANLEDQRSSLDLARTSFPWFFGWTANLSLPRAAYLAVGGFDLDIKGWGFEDADLSYRLYKHGLHLAFVENGWVIELPQPRTSTPERFQSNLNNMLQCYTKQRTLALESMMLTILQLRTWIMAFTSAARAEGNAGASPQIENIADKMRDQFTVQATAVFEYLTALKQKEPIFAEKPDFEFARPALLIGGTAQDSEHFDYVTVGDEQIKSTPSVWSSYGIVIPLPDQSLETVVVSPVWKKLDWSIKTASGLRGSSLLEKLLSEIQRSARKVIFLDDPSQDNDGLSAEALANICAKQGLDFKIVTPSIAR